MRIYAVRNRETISSLTSSVGFTSTYIPPTDKEVIYAIMQAVDGDVRFCVDGTTPTSSKGLRLTQDSNVEVWGAGALTNFRCIDDGGTAKLEVVYMGRGTT